MLSVIRYAIFMIHMDDCWSIQPNTIVKLLSNMFIAYESHLQTVSKTKQIEGQNCILAISYNNHKIIEML